MMRAVWILAILGLGACSSGENVDAGDSDAGDGDVENLGSPDAEVDTRLPDPPRNLAPCEATQCRTTALGGPPCSTYTTDDAFNAQYGLHAHTSMVWDGSRTSIRVDAEGWNPAIVLARLNGEVLFDGDVGAVRPPFDVTANGPADLVVETAQATGIIVYVTSVEALASAFEVGVDPGATYTLTIHSDCGGGERHRCVLNERDTGDPACAWLHYVGRRVVPRLEGTRGERVTAAARVAWWALKEGRLASEYPIVRSDCGGEALVPLDVCDSAPWRVGLSGVDASGRDLAPLEELAMRLHDGAMVSGILRTTANEAGLDRADAESVMQSTDALRASWLLRNSPIGFTVHAPWVTQTCFDADDPSCFGSDSPQKRAFAANRATTTRTVEDLQTLLDGLAD